MREESRPDCRITMVEYHSLESTDTTYTHQKVTQTNTLTMLTIRLLRVDLSSGDDRIVKGWSSGRRGWRVEGGGRYVFALFYSGLSYFTDRGGGGISCNMNVDTVR